MGEVTRDAAPADAVPSQVCGLPSQHQPSFGARSLIHSAGTRRSCLREPASMKHLFFSSTCGTWVTSAIPSSMVSGLRPRLADGPGRVLGPDVAELLAALDADEEVRRAGRRAVRDRVVAGQVTLGVVAVDPARLAARSARSPQPEQRDCLLR